MIYKLKNPLSIKYGLIQTRPKTYIFIMSRVISKYFEMILDWAYILWADLGFSLDRSNLQTYSNHLCSLGYVDSSQ